MNKIYLLLGSNMGNSQEQLKTATRHVEKNTGQVTAASGLYITAPWGNSDQPDFLNQVIVIDSSLTAIETLQNILEIEEMEEYERSKMPPASLISIYFF
ncbi:MAG: 2-amino-4-hydroxy-6-hydroxymethyldihydropteridine diphosphokinase [Ferruginibacter sp.]